MTELEKEELERKATESDSVIVAGARSVEALPDQVGENVRNVLPEMGADEKADSLDEQEAAIVMEIAELKDKLQAIRNVSKKKLLEETVKVDKVLRKFNIRSTTKFNELFYAGAFLVTNRLGVKIDKVADRNESILKRRLPNKIKELRRDLCQPEASKDKGIRVERLNVVIEELRITAIAAKVRSYQGRVDSYRQNRLFENNQRQFYWELDQEEERCDDDQPLAEESKQFWGNIWSQSADHKKDPKWLQDLRCENVKKQER